MQEYRRTTPFNDATNDLATSRLAITQPLETRLSDALATAARLGRQVADLKRRLGSFEAGTSDLVSGSGGVSSSHSVDAETRPPEADFDWEAWARITKARIRGQDPDSGFNSEFHEPSGSIAVD